MNKPNHDNQFVVCISNRGYKASLVVRRIYRMVPDSKAEARGLVRVIDESGEDYLFPEKLFAPIELSETVGNIFAKAT